MAKSALIFGEKNSVKEEELDMVLKKYLILMIES